MTILLTILGIILIIGVFLWTIYNRLVRAQNVIDEAFSGIDVQLKKRFSLIPQLVEVTKAYNKHESDMLERIVELRSGVDNRSNLLLIKK